MTSNCRNCHTAIRMGVGGIWYGMSSASNKCADGSGRQHTP